MPTHKTIRPEPENTYDPLKLLRESGQLFQNWPCDPNLLLDEREAALLLSVAPHTMNNWRSYRLGPPWIALPSPKGGDRISVRYRYGDLIAFAWHARTLAKGFPMPANTKNLRFQQQLDELKDRNRQQLAETKAAIKEALVPNPKPAVRRWLGPMPRPKAKNPHKYYP
jgi:hypothetical protein